MAFSHAQSHAIQTPPPALDRSQAERIRWAAIQAPSAENMHVLVPVWLDAWTLVLRTTGAYLAMSDQLRFLADITAGAMVENARAMAATYGVDLVPTWLPDAPDGARVRLQVAVGGTTGDLAEAVAARCTNRKPFRPQALPKSLTQILAEAGAEVSRSLRVSVLDGSRRAIFAEAAEVAEGARLRSRVLHDEMYAGIRFDAGWSRSTDHGIPPGSLEVELLARPAFLALRAWPLCRALASLGAARVFGRRSGRFLAERAGAVVVFDCDLPPADAAPRIGQAMERVWLRATALGLAVQPMPAAALFALPWWEGVPEDVRRRLGQLWWRLLPGRQPLMALRIGIATAPSVRAGHRDPAADR